MGIQKKEAFIGILALVILAGLSWWLLSRLWLSFLSTMDTEVLAALVTGALVASGAIYLKHIEHKHSVEAQFRDSKVKLFNEFMEMFDGLMHGDGGTEEATATIRKWKRKLLFWGGPDVVRASLLLSTMQSGNTIGSLSDPMEKMGNLILAMRKDLGLSNSGIVRDAPSGLSKGTILGARQILRHPDLFFRYLREKPSMTMKELTKIESELDKKQGMT